MKSFEYGDEEIGNKEVTFLVANYVIGFGILTLPRAIVGITKSIDGWISICLGALVALFFTGVVARLITRFPKKNLFDMSKSIFNKPVAMGITFLFAFYMMLFVSYEMRGVASIAKLYLFDVTPVEVICLVFLLVVVYGVAGPSTGLLRLNIMFIPIILFIILILIVFNITFIKMENIKPIFITGWLDVIKASKETVFSFLGFEILLFYNVHNNQPKKTLKASLIGMTIAFLLYLIVFLVAIGVFGVEVTNNLNFPTAELAKQVEIPGGFFERFESIFFTIWVMTLFSTAAMAFDVTLLALCAIFKRIKRMTFIFVLTPIIYIIAMTPQNFNEFSTFGLYISYLGIVLSMIIPSLLLIFAKISGVKGNV
jgi:spore germination protein